MADERIESREEEVARVRSYIASQSMRRTPAQLAEAMREAHQQFLSALALIPQASFHTPPHEGEWSAADVLLHVRAMAAIDLASIPAVIERGEQPTDVLDNLVGASPDITRASLLLDLEVLRERLLAVVVQSDPQAHLEVTWGHPEFGQMNWREWLLFARVHTLDHARQVQAIAAALAESGGGAANEGSD
ncbi:MAG: hypothetical protein C5B60_11670 [Chloroflexi bacterium]|nr:MAG: hypothetical protein C5B60_11670 [Chloroflexota bacterium]